MTMFTGEGITYYQISALKQGLKACKIGMRVNRAYTPTKLQATVERLSGKTFKRFDYDSMIAEVEAMQKALLEKVAAQRASENSTDEAR